MKKILLACSAGMSTSMLVQKMQQAALEMGVEAEISAVSLTEATDRIATVDIVLLGPQVRYQKDTITRIADGRIPVEAIDMRDYGMMNGKKVLEFALARLGG